VILRPIAREWRRNLFVPWLFTVVAVAAMAWIGLQSGRGAGHVPAVWWANAVLLAIVLLSRRSRRWPLLAAGYCGNVLAHFIMHDPSSQVILLSLIDVSESTFAVIAVQWWPALKPERGESVVDFTDRGNLLRFVFFGVLLGPLLAACTAAMVLRVLVNANFITAFRWFPPSALGMAIVTPLLLGLSSRETVALFAPQRVAKTLLYLGLLAITTLGIFSRGNFPLLFLLFPPLMLLVVELGVGGGALGSCVVAAIGSIYTVAGHGVMAHVQGATLEDRILILQMFLATAVLSADVVGLVLGDLKRSALIEEEARLGLKDALETLEGVARVDATTRIANRRRLDEALEEAWRRAIREGSSLSFVLMDVDHFKNYNDLYGHLAGDECLRAVAEIAASVLRRPSDLIARFGGEEFAILLPQTDETGAAQLAEQIRLAIRSAGIEHGSATSSVLTVSLGCGAVIPGQSDDLSSLLVAADRALYQAKHDGRDRVAIASRLTMRNPPENMEDSLQR
jgi:diguanylate cyclase (GGDEF)-like protein